MGDEGAGSGDRRGGKRGSSTTLSTPQQWNALPENVACLHGLNSFKVAVSELQHSRP